MNSVPVIPFAIGTWVLIGIAWLLAMPREARAKGWHYAHAFAPLVPLLLYLVAPTSARDAAALFLLSGALMLAFLVCAWALGQRLRNHSVMDIAYPIIIMAVVGFSFSQSPSRSSTQAVMLLVLSATWGLRLVAHTHRTNFRIEQQPYASLRRRFGRRWPLWSLFSVYLLQGTMVWFWCAPIVFALSAGETRFTSLNIVGVAVWLLGFFFQSVGDWQLKRFKSDPVNKGKLMQQGLWALTRHPNYFGESLMWWAYFLFALQHPWGWITILAPIYTTWFMGYGSAVPGNERHMRKTRPAYEDYAERVPRFWPRLTVRR